MKLKLIAHINRNRLISRAETAFLQVCKKHFTKKTRRNYKYQALLGNMIVDFWFKLKALVIEIDGPEHDKARDQRRDLFLLSHGLTTIRFTNQQIKDDALGCFNLVMSYPDRFKTHSKASGSVHKLLKNNKLKSIGNYKSL